MTELRNRGLRDVYIVCTDGLKGFPDAIGSVFPKAQVQTCTVHMIRASLNYVGWKERKALAADLKPIYRAATTESAELALTAFRGRWPKHQVVADAWQRNWARVIPFFQFPRRPGPRGGAALHCPQDGDAAATSAAWAGRIRTTRRNQKKQHEQPVQLTRVNLHGLSRIGGCPLGSRSASPGKEPLQQRRRLHPAYPFHYFRPVIQQL